MIGPDASDGEAPFLRMEYNLRALVWESLGLTLHEFRETCARGDFDSDSSPAILPAAELLVSVAVPAWEPKRR